MLRKAGITAAAALLLAALPLHAQSGSLADARQQLDNAEKLLFEERLSVPSCDQNGDIGEHLGKQAKRFNIKSFKAAPAASTEVPRTPMRLQRLQVSGSGDWGDVESMLHRVTMLRISRVADFESLHLKPATGDDVTFDATIAVACWDESSKAMDVAMQRGGSVEQMELAMYNDRVKKVRATIAAMQGLEQRMQPTRFFDALILLADAWYSRAVRVNDLQYIVPALTLRGVALGATGRAAVETALHRTGYEGTQITWSETGDCDGFTATARLNAQAPPRGEALGMPIFTNATCAPMPAKAGTSIAKRGTGDLTVHLHNVDIGTVFLALNGVSPKDGFIVDPGLNPRVNVDLDNVTMDEALAAIRASGVAFPTTGPLHRVCKQECAAPAAKNQIGEPISFSVADADIIDILRTFQQITGLKIHGPRDLRGTISIYVTDVPWLGVFDSVFDAFHQKADVDGENFYIGDRTKAVPVEQLAASASEESGLTISDPSKISADDVYLTGLAGANGKWTGFARLPGSAKRMMTLTPESKLLNASVTAVTAGGVTLRTASGRQVVLKLE